MELLSAFSSLERIAVVCGAMAIGYWGFRLFASDRVAGLIFMGIACGVLVGVLATIDRLDPVLQSSGTSTVVPASEPNESRSEVELTASPVTPVRQSNSGDAATQPLATVAEPPANPPETPSEPDEILGARGLGGRVVAVKSENVTLEWTPPDD